MRIVTCPEELDAGDHLTDLTVFPAGGITGCPDWQSDVITSLIDQPRLVLVNPRRENFDTKNPSESLFQIQWEYRHLRKCDVTLFWFPKETLCPITLYELGNTAASGRKMIVGCHPEYARLLDVQEQLRLCRPDVKVYLNLNTLISKLENLR